MYDRHDLLVVAILTCLILLNIVVLVGAFSIPVLRIRVLTVIATAISLIVYIGTLNMVLKK